MRTFTTHLQTIIMMVFFAIGSAQNANASAKAGEASVYESSTETITLDEIVDITVYRDNGMTVFSGKTNSVENLSKGLYIV